MPRDIKIALDASALLTWLVGIGILFWAAGAHAGDPTGFWRREIAAGRAPSSEWWNGLHDKHARPCCSHADGLKVEDVDWDSKDGHYRVYARGWKIAGVNIPDGWIEVPDNAVIDEPNLYGSAVVWPYLTLETTSTSVAAIRCFMKGWEG